jgi:HSP20 family protein
MHTLHERAMVDPTEWMEELEGQLAIDVYQTEEALIIKAPIAGVRQEDLEVSITEEQVTIKGERRDQQEGAVEEYLLQECYWGTFSRTFALPIAVDADKAQARLVDGILTITIPKSAQARTRTIAVQAG